MQVANSQNRKVLRRRKRRAVVISVLILLIVAAIMLTRAFFLNFDFSKSTDTELALLPMLVNTSPNISVNPIKATQAWGSQISDAYALPVSEGVWVKVATGSILSIGELTRGGYREISKIDPAAVLPKLFDDKSILYIEQGLTDQIIGISNGLKDTLLSGEEGEHFSSFFFNPERQEIYYLVSAGDEFALKLRRANGKVLTVYQGSGLQDPRISGLSFPQQKLDIQGKEGCLRIDLQSKSQGDIKCEAMTANQVGVNYLVPIPASGQFVSTEAGSIHKFVGEQSSVFAAADVGFAYDQVHISSPYLVAVYNEIVETSLGFSTLKPMRVDAFSLGDGTLIKSLVDLPEGEILDVGVTTGGDVYLVINDVVDGVQSVWSYTSSGWQSVLVDLCSGGCEYEIL